MRVRLDYGREGIDVELPDRNVVGTLAYQDAPPIERPRHAVREALRTPNATPPLSELAHGRCSACILICDITRPVPNELLLTPILETLEAAGIARDAICILVATGLHRASTKREIQEMVGERIAAGYRIENHDGRDSAQHVYLGDSPNGVPIWMDRRYVDAELKITVGLIEPHFMAGFSGGRKLICPGVAGIETIQAWHSPRFLENENARSGVLAGNPVHAENTWIARRTGCDFIVNVVIDAKRQPLKVVAGEMVQAFEEGVAFVRSVVVDTLTEPVDIVVTSSAGHPLDATFYQSVKGMAAAAPLVKDGGSIILAAGMSEGIGSPEFAGLFDEHPDLDSFMTAIVRDDYFVMDQWQLEKMAAVCRKAEITVVTDGLPAETLERLFVRSAPSVEAAIQRALTKHGEDATIAVIPKGPYVLAETTPA